MTIQAKIPDIVVVFNNPDDYEATGIIGWVEVFGSRSYRIDIRPNKVIIDGCAVFSPKKARVFAKAIRTAVRVAENYSGITTNSDGDEDIS
jgi:hypothetical protein